MKSIPPQTQYSFLIKLNPSNFLVWKTQFNPIIKCYNLGGHIDGTKPAPSETVLNSNTKKGKFNPKFAIWVQNDQMLLSWILSSLNEEVIPYAVDLETSYEV